jgi:hypothetical protein
VSHSGWLKVKDPVDTEPAILKIHDEVNITALRFSRVQLLCPVLGWPKPRVRNLSILVTSDPPRLCASVMLIVFLYYVGYSSSYPYPTKWGRYNMFFIML